MCGVALAFIFVALGSCTDRGPAKELALQVGERSLALVTLIDTCAELQAMENDLSGDYQLAADVDCAGFDAGDGKGFRPVGVGGWVYTPFEGHFDGAGHVIRNLTINRPLEDSVGLFGLAGAAVIERVGLEDVSIVGYEAVGAVVGATEGTLVREVYATGSISGHLSGGVVGFLKHEGILRDSYSRLTVDWNWQGGLLCDYLYYDAQLERSYAVGTGDEGRLYGDIGEGGAVVASFFDCTVAGDCSNEGGESTTNLKSQSFLSGQGWDFTSTWAISSVDGYPCLRWQAGCGSAPDAGTDAGMDAGDACTLSGADTDCDGVDDDCDGTADDNYAPQPTQCGTGACAATGSTSCVNGAVQDSCAAGTPASSDATCNGVDEDCSGANDEDFAAQPTSCGTGACARTGTTACVGGSVQDSCAAGSPAAGDPTCDGVDDDCDGAADEDYEPVPTSCGLGACATVGLTSCVGGQVQKSCQAGVPAGSDADCDGVDDDCNGTADEDYPAVVISCGTGACGRQGMRSCIAGQVVEFCQTGAGAQIDSVCDGIDTDCDGDVDEDYVGVSTRCGVGACEAAGLQVCSAGQFADTCRPGLPAPSDLTCDGRDDDCDGVADEDALAFEMTCGTGACATTATAACVAGAWAGKCVPLPAPSTDDADCDGIDDDCDGAIDDDAAPIQVSCGVGACANTGVSGCVGGQLTQSCVPWPALSSTDDLCDGADGDCDGSTDEDFVAQPTTCGQGVCARTGTRSCSGGQVVDSCAPGAPAAPQDTTCNGVDDDCDGAVDEDYSGTCSAGSAQVCVAGQVVTQATCSDGVLCNGSESCSAGQCTRTPLLLDDMNPCTIDACSEMGGVTHADAPFGSSCSDGNACNGVEVCLPCMESDELLVNGSFERVSTPSSAHQGVLPTDWWTTANTPDTYSMDGSWGLHPTYLGNFSNVQSVPDGVRWVAGAGSFNGIESFAQELRAPLVPGQRYRLTAKLHQAGRSGPPGDITAPGGYTIALSSHYANTIPRTGDVQLGQIGTTGATTGWVDVALEFVAPQNIQDKLLLHFTPYSVVPNTIPSYMGLDVVRLVRACAAGASHSCQRQDPPAIDDANPCTADTCSAGGGVQHTALAVGTACHGTGTCTASADCTNHPPVITNEPKPYTIIEPGSQYRFYQHQFTASDPDGDPITFSKATPSSVEVSPAGAVNVGGYLQSPAVFILHVRASDGRGGTTEQRRLFQFINSEPPVPMLPTQPTKHAVVAGEQFTHRAKIWSQDPGTAASFAFLSVPPDGMAVDATGLISWTPGIEDVGTHEVTVEATTSLGSVEQTFLVSVLGSPDAPRFTSTPITFVQVGLTYTYQPTALAGTQQLAVHADVLPAGMTQDPSTGILSWTPSRQQLGSHQIVLAASHGDATARQEFTLRVVGAADDRPPVVEPLRVPRFIDAGVLWTIDVDAYDPEGTPVTYYAAGLPTGATLDANTGVLAWTPPAAYANQTVAIRLGVVDGSGLQMATDIRVTVRAATAGGNRPPQITSVPTNGAKVGLSYHYQLLANDPDGDPVRLAASELPAGAVFDVNSGALDWVPAAIGPASITLQATDALGHVTSQDFTVYVIGAAANLPPEITSTPVTEALVYEAYTYEVNAFEGDGEPVAFALATAPEGMTIDPLTGEIHWLPAESGHVQVQVVVRDASDGIDTQSFSIQVHADLDPPLITVSTNPAAPVIDAPTRVLVDIQDEGAVVTEVRLDGQLVALDASSGFDTTFTTAGYHEVLVHSADANGNQVTQSFRVPVASMAGQNRAPTFSSSAPLEVNVGVLYTYQLSASDPDGDPLVFTAPRLAPGATFDPSTRVLSWTPVQAGSARFSFRATDPLGASAVQELTLVAQPPVINLAPRILSTPPAQGFAYEPFHYDVDAFEPEAETVTYALESAPSGMTIDAQSGEIDWTPTAGGNFDVEVTARDPENATATQSFRIEVWADEEAPLILVNSTPRYPSVNQSTRISVDVQDEGPVPTREVLLDGVPVTLDVNDGITTSFAQAGRHEVVVTATDSAGNQASQTYLIGVSADGTPALAPALTIHNVVDDEVVTLQKSVTISVADDDLLSYRLSLIDAGDRTTEVRLLRLGSAPATALAAGTIDATQLINGFYVLRLAATDFAGHTSTLDVPVKIDGGAKIGIVQLSLVDTVIHATGFDLQVVRSYDSRRAHQEGDFGFGWELDLKGPRVRNNRPVGEGYGIWNTGGPFSLPCNAQGESRSHFTEVRISDDEFYVFSPSVANVQAVSGACTGEVVFDQLDGSAIGAELVVVGDSRVYASRNGISAAGMNLMNVVTGELYNAKHFQLSTPDGRLFDLTTTDGLNWVQDANGNTLSIREDHVSHSDGGGFGFVRDARGRISAVRQRDGSSITYTYDGAGDLRATTSAEGFRTRYEYDTNVRHHLRKMIDPEGVEQSLFTYDADGRLIQSCGAENHCVELQHDLANQTEWFIDGEEELRYTYDARGNVLTETNALNETWTYTYDAYNRVLTSLSPLNELTTHTYDRNGNLLSKVDPHEVSESAADFTTTYTYGALDRRTGMTLPSGGAFSWQYDGRGNEIAMRDGSNNLLRSRVFDQYGRMTQETNRFGTWQRVRSPDGRVYTITDPLGRVTTLIKHWKGMLEGQQENGVQVWYSYDRDRRLVRADYGNGLSVDYAYTGSSAQWSAISGPTFGRVERLFWADGKLSRVTEPNGDVREFYYDANRRLTREHDALGNDTRYTRNAAGRVTRIREDATGAETDFTHDAAGRVLTRTDPLERTTAMTYRAGGRLASITDARNHTRTFSETPTSRTVVDALSRTTVRQLSAYGLTTATNLPGGTSTSLSYLGQTRSDESERFPLSVSDEGSRARSYGYDAHGGLTSASDLGGQNAWAYSYGLTRGGQVAWDGESGDVRLVPVDARASAYEFSSQGDLLNQAPQGFTSDGVFTSELSTVSTPGGDVTTYERDSSGRPQRATLPWGAQKTYSYTDADANPERVTLPQGTTLTYTYDAAKRELSRTSSAGESRSFVYGPNDRLASMTDATGTTTYEYDTAGRFAGIVYPHSGSVRYVRDLLGRTVRQEVRATAAATPLVTQYAYDEVGNLIEVIDPQNGSTTFVYDAENRLSTRTLPNGVVTTYTYDARDRPLSVVHRNASNVVLVSRTYVRAPGGEPTRITKQDGSYVEIGYDAALRITSERYYTAAGVLEEELGYTYDADGNRLTKTRDGVVSTYSYAAGSRLLGVSTEGDLEARVTDSGGRETGLSVDGRQLSLTYDSDDHVTRVVDGSATIDFAFDAAGRRVGVTTASGTKRFLMAPNAGDGFESPQAVTDASGTVIASYVYAGEEPLMKLTTAGVYYYLADKAGTILAVLGPSAGLELFDHDSFGNPRGADTLPSDTHGDFRLQRMWREPHGLYYVRARTYDAETGTFTTRDPASGCVKRPETLAPYVIDHGNPWMFVDPTGRASFSLSGLGAAQAGASALSSLSVASSLKIFTARLTIAVGVAYATGADDLIALGVRKLLVAARSRAKEYEHDEECKEEWEVAIAQCEEQLSRDWRNRDQGITGGYTNVEDCARGLVSEECGGSPTGNPRPDLPLH